MSLLIDAHQEYENKYRELCKRNLFLDLIEVLNDVEKLKSKIDNIHPLAKDVVTSILSR